MNENFRIWLIESQKLNERSAGDVLSRLKRVSGITEVNAKLKTDQILFNISQKPEFKVLSASVRSQLRRSIKLYHIFLKEN